MTRPAPAPEKLLPLEDNPVFLWRVRWWRLPGGMCLSSRVYWFLPVGVGLGMGCILAVSSGMVPADREASFQSFIVGLFIILGPVYEATAWLKLVKGPMALQLWVTPLAPQDIAAGIRARALGDWGLLHSSVVGAFLLLAPLVDVSGSVEAHPFTALLLAFAILLLGDFLQVWLGFAAGLASTPGRLVGMLTVILGLGLLMWYGITTRLLDASLPELPLWAGLMAAWAWFFVRGTWAQYAELAGRLYARRVRLNHDLLAPGEIDVEHEVFYS